VDHNADSISIAKLRGLRAYTVEEFVGSPDAVEQSFDSILLAHVLEHVSDNFGRELIGAYLPYLKEGGTLCLITPQESGFRTDATHVNFVDFEKLATVSRDLGFTVARQYSFPFPRAAGKVFPYNEFVSLATRT
jgi:2-polyprenyl-3-methyl-5-hydroxy-6-metoxy-1,4-benzoquinol methylase